MRVMAVDPGTSSYAWNCADIKVQKGVIVYKQLGAGFITDTIVNLTPTERWVKISRKKEKIYQESFKRQLGKFNRRWDELFQRFKPEVVGSERFQTRGNGGPLIEQISGMNILLMNKTLARGAEPILYMAATWKYRVNEHLPIEQLYKAGEIRGLATHNVDSMLMSLYLFTLVTEGSPELVNKRLLLKIIRDGRIKE